MEKKYTPSAIEESWYRRWETSGFFTADSSSSKPQISLILPPPNVTGALHLGHGLNVAIQDTIVRWRRMSGYNVLWVPGMDHAGIATQVAVEKKLMRENKVTRHDIGRQRFISQLWDWKNEHGGTILNQERRLGASPDWSREFFTMDEARSKAVTEAFVRLYKEGLIYRDQRIVNWDCTLQTTISDAEVDLLDISGETYRKIPDYDDEVQFGILISFAYPLEGDLGEIVVATTRVETMLGDTAIAVHSNDKRYTHLHGKRAVHPFNGRKLPVICDDNLVNFEYGTGAVKITPAHDPNEFLVGKHHHLEFINIFTDDGKINSNGGAEFEGMPRFTARMAVTEALRTKVYLHPMIYDSHGQKMSKSKGNVIDPLDLINGISLEGLHKKLDTSNLDQSDLEKAKMDQSKDFPNGIPECGADALRFALVSCTVKQDYYGCDTNC
ncbi:hypothetical protein OPV22_003816 [Ensete ventricosum]|uniref:valine--tRNA ligase n=1 Tax=Ensete ventricosum TaxID=4639 RepID=A0AAV8S1Y9_ENSVE|nr:hypothetical protein OPV22_003816 [Ensete ventricosum]